jgi:hypothetical protein
MAKSCFRDKIVPPTDEMLASVLGNNKELWDEFTKNIESTYPNQTAEWKFYGTAWGWFYVYSRKKKKLIYLTPAESCFAVTLSFNEEGHDLSKAMSFSDDVMRISEVGKTNPNGRTFDIPINQRTDLRIAKKLLEAKTASYE